MKEKINEHERLKILKELQSYQNKDFTFSSGRILGSMCTQPHPIAKEAYIKFLETNLGDPELFPGSKEIESKLISFFMNLLNAPKTATGLICSFFLRLQVFNTSYYIDVLSRKCSCKDDRIPYTLDTMDEEERKRRIEIWKSLASIGRDTEGDEK